MVSKTAKDPNGTRDERPSTSADGGLNRVNARKFNKAYEAFKAGHADIMPELVAAEYAAALADKTGNMQVRVRKLVSGYYQCSTSGALVNSPTAVLNMITHRKKAVDIGLHSTGHPLIILYWGKQSSGRWAGVC